MTPRPLLTRAAVVVAAAAAALAASLAAPLRSHGGDVTPGRLGALALTCHRSFDLRSIDAFDRAAARGALPYYLTRSRTGAVVSSFGPAPAVMTAPWMRSLRPGTLVGERALLRRARYGAAAAVALATALLAIALLAEASAPAALGLSLAAGLSFAGAATLGQAPWQQTAALPWLAGALAALAWSRRRPSLAVLAVAAAVAGAMIRPPALPLFAGVAAAGALSLGRDRRRLLAALSLAALAAAPLAAWNLHHHGALLGGGQRAANAAIAGGAAVWTLDPRVIAARLAALAVSPARGVLWFAPLVVVGLVAALRGRDRGRRAVALGGLAQALVASAFFNWHGGDCLGPRLLAELVWAAPWLALAAEGRGRRAAAVAAACTVAVGLVAVARFDPRRWELQHDLGRHPAAAWSVTDGPLVALVAAEPVGLPLRDGPAGPFVYCAPTTLRAAPRPLTSGGPATTLRRATDATTEGPGEPR